MKFKVLLSVMVLGLSCSYVSVASDLDAEERKVIEASRALIGRVVPEIQDKFIVEYIPEEDSMDVYEIESKGNKIVLRGNNGVSVASALNLYLEDFLHCHVSWNASNLDFPEKLPKVKDVIRKTTPYKYRHYYNYCTFNYTCSWWDWERWQFEIDYMALHGINMPLSMTGQNIIWDKVYKELGLSQQDMDEFFTGPAYFMWFWAGNIDAWCGPLPQSWMKSHEELQKKILEAERSLGMTPVLPAFTGHVPPAFKEKFPEAKINRTNWEARFADTYILDPKDPMFKTVGNLFMEKLIETYGTDHLYGADTFNEMYPPSNDSTYLHNISNSVWQAMADVDQEAVWVMQGWLFWDKANFWQPEQMQNYLGGVPDDNLIVLDLWAEEHPVWERTDAFYGKQWIWCMLHNFGGRNMLYGNAHKLAREPARVLNDENNGRLMGIGAVPEGIEQNPMIYSLLFQQIWDTEEVDLRDWLDKYVTSRYGKLDKNLRRAWEILSYTVYANEGDYQSAIMARPTFDNNTTWAYTEVPYSESLLLEAWELMLASQDEFKDNACYNYDLLLVGKQVLNNYSSHIQRLFREDWRTNDYPAFLRNREAFLTIIDDIDRLMATHEAFLLGKWLEDAKKWGTTAEEKALYEKNARDIITLWGGKDAFLHDYSSRQWSGLYSGFYKGRWTIFLDELEKSLSQQTSFDIEKVTEKVVDWEWEWVNGSELYNSETVGNTVTVSNELYEKYIDKLR